MNGQEFEDQVKKVLAKEGLDLDPNYTLLCGVEAKKKDHRFDLGSDDPKVIVECKSHKWPPSGNVPAASMKNWAVAMYYFCMAPPEYRKIFVVERSVHPRRGESLLDYFLRNHAQLIPSGVECREL